MTEPSQPPLTIYKLVDRVTWQSFQDSGEFRGTPADIGDGYIHFSTIRQLPATLKRYFRGQVDLMLLLVDAEKLSDLHWEVSPDGGVYPHLYGEFPLSAVTEAVEIPVDESGRSYLPQEYTFQES